MPSSGVTGVTRLTSVHIGVQKIIIAKLITTYGTEIGASAQCVEQYDRPIIMRVVQKQLYLSAWSKGLKCTEKACKILRKGSLRRQCYNMIIAIEAVKNGRSIRSKLTKCLPFIMIHHQSKFIQV